MVDDVTKAEQQKLHDKVKSGIGGLRGYSFSFYNY